jgi:hypothetical protein
MLEMLTNHFKFGSSRKATTELEFLFATHKGTLEVNKVLQQQEDRPRRAAIAVAATVMAYAGANATHLSKSLFELANSKEGGKFPGYQALRKRVDASFDQIFTETASMCFYLALHQSWNDEAVADSSRSEADYLRSLIQGIDFADGLISDASPKIPASYLQTHVRIYESELDGPDRAANLLCTNLVNLLFAQPDPLGVFLGGICMTAVGRLSPAKLDRLCRLAHEQALNN